MDSPRLWNYPSFISVFNNLLLYDVHLLDEALATAELVNYEEHVADVDVDATLQVVVEVDVAAE